MIADGDDLAVYRALPIKVKQIINELADSVVVSLRTKGYGIGKFKRGDDPRYRVTLEAIAIWIRADETATTGGDDAAAAPSLERGRSRNKNDDDEEIEAERKRSSERGRGGGR